MDNTAAANVKANAIILKVTFAVQLLLPALVAAANYDSVIMVVYPSSSSPSSHVFPVLLLLLLLERERELLTLLCVGETEAIEVVPVGEGD